MDQFTGSGQVCSDDPRIDQFCANAVLTMHSVEAAVDATAVFAMLTEQQLHTVPGSQELHREIARATEGPGSAGMLMMQITDKLGIIDSVSRSQIITTERETLIAQLTVTALHESPVDRASISLTVRACGGTSPASAGRIAGAPVSRTKDGA